MENQKNKIIQPYHYDEVGNISDTIKKADSNTRIPLNDDVVAPYAKASDEEDKCKIHISFILDITYSMYRIYNILYRRLCEEIDKLKTLDADISMKFTLVSENGPLNKFDTEKDTEKFKKHLLEFEFSGGSEYGYEEYLNHALNHEVKSTDMINDADIKGIILITDSMASENSMPDDDFSNINLDFVCIYVGEPQTDNFIRLNNKSMIKIQEFLYAPNGVIYSILNNKMQSLGKRA